MATRRTGSPATEPTTDLRSAARRRLVSGVWWARSRSFIDRAGDESNTVLLLGSARSGTTWVGELIDRHHDHRVVFEPFRPGALTHLTPFQSVRYLRPDHDAPDLAARVRVTLRGRFRNRWTDHMTSPGVFHRRLVKEVRVNCLAPWLVAQFPQVPTIMVVRHPVSVVRSRMALGWHDELDALLADPGLVARLSQDQARMLRQIDDPFVRAVGQWALETAVPLWEMSSTSARVVLYEDLAADPLLVGASLLAHVGQRPDSAFEEAVSRPSRTTQRGGVRRGEVPTATLARAGTVLRAFGLDRLYAIDDPEPRPAALAHFAR